MMIGYEVLNDNCEEYKEILMSILVLNTTLPPYSKTFVPHTYLCDLSIKMSMQCSDMHFS